MKKNHNPKNHDTITPANQCVASGAEMPEGDQDELSAYRATGLTPEAVQEMVSFPYTADEEDETKMMANQCVVCGHEMPEGDQVCKACRAQAETWTVAWAAENISGRIVQLEAEVGTLKRLLEKLEVTHDD